MPIGKGENIEMLARRYNYFPANFRWRGRRFAVLAVEKCWTGAGQPARRLFRVRCADGSFTLEQALAQKHGAVAAEQWRVRRWPLRLWLMHGRRAAAPRYPLPRAQRRPQATVQPVLVAAKAATAAPKERPWTHQLQRT
jgi:hypothetical protein